MPTAFVTGATGFVGRHLVDVLTENGWDIIAAVRSISKGQALLPQNVSLKEADLRKPLSIREAMPDDLDAVFHVAADTSSWSEEAERQYSINVNGTASMLQAALDKNTKRFVHVSSIVVYGEHDETLTDDTPRLGAESSISYVMTKSYAERKVKEAVDRGMDAVIVNPTDILGKYDDQNWIRMIEMLDEGTLPAVPPGNGVFANGRAVAEAILAAYKVGQTGQNYILGGPKATFHEFLSLAAEKLGKPAPKKPLPPFLIKLTARVLSWVSSMTEKRPSITPEEAHFACQNYDATSDKAVSELGYRIVPLEQSVEEAVGYLRKKQAKPS